MAKWKWATSVDLNKEKCAASCGEALRAYTGSLVDYDGRTWHVHCLLDHLVGKEPEVKWNPGAGIDDIRPAILWGPGAWSPP